MKAQKIALTALMSALIFVTTAYLIVPLVAGYINLGDTFILLTSALLGPFAGGICGALGAGLADFVTGYVMYMPFTVVIKFAEGVLFGFLFKLVKRNKKVYFVGTLLSLILSTFVMGFGYFISNLVLFDLSVAIADVVYECIQAGVSVVVAMTALMALSHIDYFVKNFGLKPIFKKRKYDYGAENMAKRVAVINDLSSFGKCSLTASMPIFSCMGIQACPLPTAVLSCQTGFDEYFKQDMTFVWDDYFNSWHKMGITFDAIQSGYVTCGDQIKRVKEFVNDFGNGDTLLVVDPVLGDDGELYSGFSMDMVDEMKGLIANADFCTPNLTELCLLCGVDAKQVLDSIEQGDFFDLLKGLCQKILDTGCKAVVVTGIRRGKNVYNYLLEDKQEFKTCSPSFKANMSGAGDIFCSILTAEVMTGKTLLQAVEVADEFLTNAIMDTTKGKFDTKHGINFEKHLRDLT